MQSYVIYTYTPTHGKFPYYTFPFPLYTAKEYPKNNSTIQKLSFPQHQSRKLTQNIIIINTHYTVFHPRMLWLFFYHTRDGLERSI